MTLFRAFWLIFLPVLIAIRLTWVCSADALSFGRISISQFQAIEHMLFYFQPVLLAASSYLLIRPFDVLTRRVFDDRVLKIGSDTFRGLLQLHHVFVGRFAQFRFGTYRRPLAHGLFEIRI